MLHKIKTIYVKELTETLRDRRTLFAMIGVPLLLYPLMMYGITQIKLFEAATLSAERYVVAVDDEAARVRLRHILDTVRAGTHSQPTTTQATATAPAGGLEIVVAQVTPDQIGEQIHARVTFEQPASAPAVGEAASLEERISARISYRKTKVRSDAAARILDDAFQQYGRQLVDQRLTHLQATLDASGMPLNLRSVLTPVEVHEEPVDTQREVGGHLLSIIVPFILILMTATGAVYPAIDLTAGERERGTLETLLVAPVTPLALTTGKFLVVTTIAVVTSLLNVASIAGMVYFGGVMKAIAPGDVGTVPLYTIPVIVLSLIPYAVLTSAMMIAVCSVARSFKEAQNYVTPLIVLILVPAGVGTMQTMRLEGAMLVTPIANVTLFVRDLLQENTTFATAAIVLGSTTLYAAAAVAVATRLFGQEAVLFADAAPLKAMFARRFMKRRVAPSTAMALVTVAVLFPAVFVGQMGLHNRTGGDWATFLKLVALMHVVLFVVLPAGLCAFNKVDVVTAFRLRVPPVRFWVAALLLGSSTGLLAIAALDALTRGRPMPEELVETGTAMAEALQALGLPMALLLVAVAPAFCEELLFRGFLLSGLATGLRKWGTVLTVGVIFGAFHFALLRFPITATLGAILAYVCWQSRSVWPGVLVHVMHNGSFMFIAATANGHDNPVLRWLHDKSVLRVDPETQAIAVHRPALFAAAGIAVVALLLCYRRRDERLTAPSDAR